MRLSGIGLACVRGGREVFSGLGFTLAGGEALAITGRNGAGKSSLLRIIAGLLHPAAGEIRLDGAADGELTLAERAHYLGHRDALKPALTVAENLTFWRDMLGGDGGDVTGTLAACGIGHAALLPAGFLSAGQRRRLSMARLVVAKRPVWLLDEPTSALDAEGQRLVARLMGEHLAGGGMIVAATHGPLGIDTRTLAIGAAP